MTAPRRATLRRALVGGGEAATVTWPRRIVRGVRIGVVVAAVLVMLQSVLLVAGAWRNDLAIEGNMGVAQAEVLSAGPRRSTIEFVTPERITYRPELGVLYPSELATGMRIYVEYDKTDPDLVRVAHRTAALAVIPAGSITVAALAVAAVLISALAAVDRRLARRLARQVAATSRSSQSGS